MASWRLLSIVCLVVISALPSHQARVTNGVGEEDRCQREGGCSENCKGDADAEGGLGLCRTSISASRNETFEIDVRDAVYLTMYTRGCRCMSCGGMTRRECDRVCEGYGYRYYDCRRCSCQCGRETGDFSGSAASIGGGDVDVAGQGVSVGPTTVGGGR